MMKIFCISVLSTFYAWMSSYQSALNMLSSITVCHFIQIQQVVKSYVEIPHAMNIHLATSLVLYLYSITWHLCFRTVSACYGPFYLWKFPICGLYFQIHWSESVCMYVISVSILIDMHVRVLESWLYLPSPHFICIIYLSANVLYLLSCTVSKISTT